MDNDRTYEIPYVYIIRPNGMRMVVLNATKARMEFYRILDVAIGGEPVTITTESGNAVVISEEDFEGMRETLRLMSDPDFMTDVRKYHDAPDSEYEAWNRAT